MQLHCIANLMLVQLAVKIIRVCNLFAVHAKNDISDRKVTILGLSDTAQTRIGGGFAGRNLQDDHAVRDWQIKLTPERLNIAGS